MIDNTNVTATAQRSRRTRYCPEISYAHDRTIRPGDLYVRAIVFPGHDANPDGPGPSVFVMCAQCARTYPATAAALARRES